MNQDWPNQVRGTNEPAVAWLNKMLQSSKASQIKSIKVTGGLGSAKLTGNADGQDLEIYIPPPPSGDLSQFHPFQIYKPKIRKANGLWMNSAGLGYSFGTVGAQDGVLGDQGVTIDDTNPTAIDGNGNGTLNPITDGWRIWAVRSGMISVRKGVSPNDAQYFYPGQVATVTMPDCSIGLEVAGCDGYQIGSPNTITSIDTAGFPYEFNPDTTDQFGGVIPIILPPSFINNTGNYIFSIWIAQNGSNFSYPCLNGKAFDLDLDDPATIFPVPKTSFTIPVGAIAHAGYLQYLSNGQPTDLTPYQILYGNQTSGRYGCFDNSFLEKPTPAPTDPLFYSSTLNYRGSWQNDLITTNYFYVGDVVKYQTTISIQNSSTVLYVENLFMCGVAGTTSDPSTDANWTRISGVRTTTDSGKTPNTH
jgi:hypothetical protein